MDTIRHDIEEILEHNGILFDENGQFIEIDSIDYIQSIVDIELRFGVTIPDWIMSPDDSIDIGALADAVACIIKEGKK